MKVRMLKAEVLETLLYGCVTWSPSKADYGRLRKAHHLSLIHISEPTRLGMISYAVFCLKKKT